MDAWYWLALFIVVLLVCLVLGLHRDLRKADMRLALVIVLLVSVSVATDFTYQYSTRSRDAFRSYEDLLPTVRSAQYHQARRPLTQEENAADNQESDLRSRIDGSLRDWQAGSFLFLAFAGWELVWLGMLVVIPPDWKAYPVIHWGAAGSILGTLSCGVVLVSLGGDRAYVEARGFLGAAGGSIGGALVGAIAAAVGMLWRRGQERKTPVSEA